jgi:DNA-binding NarL/FixJ family response regulator
MKQKRIKVFILYDDPLFGLGLERLLRHERGIEVTGVAPRSHDGLERLRAHGPDVIDVIMVEGSEPSLGPSPWEVLKERPAVRVINLELEENRVTVYTTRRILGGGVEDLVKAVTSGLPRSTPLHRRPGDRGSNA